MATDPLSRRAALRKLGLGILAAYSAPQMLIVSSAAASTIPSVSQPSVSEPSASQPSVSQPSASQPSVSQPSGGSDPSAPEASLPSGPSDEDWREDDTCRAYSTRGDQVSISNSDFRRAQRAVRKGDALPLSDVFRSVQTEVRGQIIEVRFSNSGTPPIYQFRMVSERGKLVTVFTDASSAEILRIVNC